MDDDKDRKKFDLRIWEQEYANHQHHDTKAISLYRFLIIIEGAFVYGLMPGVITDKLHIALFTTFIMLIIILLSIMCKKAQSSSIHHLNRVKIYENELNIYKYRSKEDEKGNIYRQEKKWYEKKYFYLMILIIINITNVIISLLRWCILICCSIVFF